MKKILFGLVIVLGLSFSFSALADVPPGPDYHVLDRCVKIVDPSGLTNVVLVGVTTGPMISGRGYEAKKIEYNTCLSKGYKLNRYSVYWTTKEKFNTLNLNTLPRTIEVVNPLMANDIDFADLTFIMGGLETYGGYIQNTNPLVKERIEYTLESIVSTPESGVGNKIIIYKSKVTSEYNNGTPTKTENFTYAGETHGLGSLIALRIKTLRQGMENDNDVKALQIYLNDRHNTTLVVDGNFGLKTKLAVINFQKIKNLKADGIVGPKTIAIMNQVFQ